MNKTYQTLYHRDSKGRVREWRLELSGDKYRSVSGLSDGEHVTSEWVVALPKNVGRANETSAEQQAELEADAKYKDKLKKKYFESLTAIDDFTFHKPMLAHDYTKRFTAKNKTLDFPVWCQPKLDGIRCIVSKHGAWSRSGTEIVAVPHIVEACAPIFEKYPNMVLDGELYNHDLKSDFEKIVSLVRKVKPTAEDLAESASLVEYHVYDVMNDEPIEKRFIHALNMIEMFIKDPMLKAVNTWVCKTQEELDKRFTILIHEGYEGQMIRIPDSLYKNSRSTDLLKRKEFQDAEFEVVDILEGKGNWSGVAKHLVIKLPNGETCQSGMRGSMERARYILENKELFIGKQATVRFQEYTQYGVPRFPVAVALHEIERL